MPTPEPTVAVEPTPHRETAVTAAIGAELLDAMGLSASELCDRLNGIDEAETAVFLDLDVSADELAAIEAEVRRFDPDARFVSQEDAVIEFTEELFPDQEAITDLVTPEILPASFRLQLTGEDRLAAATTLESLPGVRRVIGPERGIPQLGEAVVAACAE